MTVLNSAVGQAVRWRLGAPIRLILAGAFAASMAVPVASGAQELRKPPDSRQAQLPKSEKNEGVIRPPAVDPEMSMPVPNVDPQMAKPVKPDQPASPPSDKAPDIQPR